MTAYYNEIDRYCCDWLQNLMDAGHITPGKIDDRSIVDVRPGDLAGYERAHFFAGIAGWDHALNLAGWHGPVWTGSCPCQPLSSAGQQRGHADERHLWPAFHALIAQCRPPVVFGEQVASKDGREWLAGVRADLEHSGYACGAADLSAAGAGAPHVRQRLYWVATGVADRDGGRQPQLEERNGWAVAGLAASQRHDALGRGLSGGLGDAAASGWPRGDGTGEQEQGPGARCAAGFWDACDLVPCSDGKTRRTGPGIFPLAHGVPGRVGKLRAAGNAIVPQVAAGFIAAVLEAREAD